MEDIQAIKQRFEIIGNNPGLNRAIDIATQVAPTDLSVLITGESGVGKEIFPRIIHAYSTRKHAQYIAVNCGAIPEGTIDSELFGHEKGAFTGAVSDRKGVSRLSSISCSTTLVTSVRRSSASCSIVTHNFATKLTSMLV